MVTREEERKIAMKVAPHRRQEIRNANNILEQHPSDMKSRAVIIMALHDPDEAVRTFAKQVVLKENIVGVPPSEDQIKAVLSANPAFDDPAIVLSEVSKRFKKSQFSKIGIDDLVYDVVCGKRSQSALKPFLLSSNREVSEYTTDQLMHFAKTIEKHGQALFCKVRKNE